MDSAAAHFSDDRNASADTQTRVHVAGLQGTARIADVLTMAFADDPPTRWLYPDGDEFRRNVPDFIRAFGGDSVELGTTYRVEDSPACAERGAGLQRP